MTENVKPDPLENEILNFSFTVGQTNAFLQQLGQRPYMEVAPLIGLIRGQGEQQFQALLEKEAAKNESKATS